MSCVIQIRFNLKVGVMLLMTCNLEITGWYPTYLLRIFEVFLSPSE